MEAKSDVRVTIRVERDLKERAENLFARLGLNMSTALNVFLRKAVEEESIPFPVSTKSSAFGNGYTSAEVNAAFAAAVRNETEESRRRGMPVARYDAARKQAYIEAADGSREYIHG
ncbi:MAG: type II toxin-antitoxin system RelB/DinJ family antitoxin [Clostridiales bacterium]|nr:type II toxin-antitoxin system RelB/DinJ family antitoxin [Clostridiales bacterium]